MADAQSGLYISLGGVWVPVASVAAAGILEALPSGLTNQSLRHDGDVWVANNTLQIDDILGVAVPGSGYYNFDLPFGNLGYGFRDNVGVVEFKNFGGSWMEIGAGGTTTWTSQSVADGTTAINMGSHDMVTCTLTQNSTFTAASGTVGQHTSVILTENATGGWAASFTTGFDPLRTTYIADANEKIGLLFAYDGTLLVEIGQPVNGVLWGVAFAWNFKMVDATNFATPEISLTVVPTISKDGAAFAALTGSPVVSEVGYGWYRVIVPAVDMQADSIVLRATAAGAAQTDRSIYTIR